MCVYECVCVCVCVCWTLYMSLQILFSSTLSQTPAYSRRALDDAASGAAASPWPHLLHAHRPPVWAPAWPWVPRPNLAALWSLCLFLTLAFHPISCLREWDPTSTGNASTGNGKDSINRSSHPVLPSFSGISEAWWFLWPVW